MSGASAALGEYPFGSWVRSFRLKGLRLAYRLSYRAMKWCDAHEFIEPTPHVPKGAFETSKGQWFARNRGEQLDLESWFIYYQREGLLLCFCTCIRFGRESFVAWVGVNHKTLSYSDELAHAIRAPPFSADWKTYLFPVATHPIRGEKT